jgi:hypothetical protein
VPLLFNRSFCNFDAWNTLEMPILLNPFSKQGICATDLTKMASRTYSTPCTKFSIPWNLAFIAAALSTILSNCCIHEPAPSTQPIPHGHTLRTKVFLGARDCGSGVVGGRPGEFTNKALASYQQATGMEKDLGALSTLASGPEQQSKQVRIPYTTLPEPLRSQCKP